MLALLLVMLAPGGASTDTDVSLGDADPADTATTVYDLDALDVARPIICTPNNGNDYWVDYCHEWVTSDEDVIVVEDLGGADDWCVIYPLPCAPTPADPVQTGTHTAALTRPVTTASVDSDEVCQDTTGAACPTLPLCMTTLIQCPIIYIDASGMPDQWPGDGPAAFADIDADGFTDGLAFNSGYDWYYVGACDGVTLSTNCMYAYPASMVVSPLTSHLTPCTPATTDYWIEHCERYDPKAESVNTVGVSVTYEEVCVIYPVPCADKPVAQAQLTRTPMTVWTYDSEGEEDRYEATSDVCQLGCPTYQDVQELCDRIDNAIARQNVLDLNCDIYVYTMMAALGTVYFPTYGWEAEVEAGLADRDGDGMAEGVAWRIVPADGEVDPINTDPFLAISDEWFYADFPACTEVDPVWLIQYLGGTNCAFTLVPPSSLTI